MPQKALRVKTKLYVNAVSCPGVHLPLKDDIYLSVRLMNQYRMSQCLPAVFPLLFKTQMTFDKVCEYASDPADVAEMLQCETVKVELIQLIPPVGEVLAVYEVDARSFLFPQPKLLSSFSRGGREVLMIRDPTFPGISPRLEFSTRTKISECGERDLLQCVPVAAYYNSSDADVLLANAEEQPRHNNPSGHERSPSSVALSCSKITSMKPNSFLYSSNSWEVVQDRVRSLLTSPQAVRRLVYGATMSERDEVMERRFIS